jgi:ankyrin repeat protein
MYTKNFLLLLLLLIFHSNAMDQISVESHKCFYWEILPIEIINYTLQFGNLADQLSKTLNIWCMDYKNADIDQLTLTYYWNHNHFREELNRIVEKGGINIMIKLFNRGISPTITSIPHNVPLISHAVSRGKKDLVKLLLEKGIDVNTPDSSHTTPLHVAVSHNQLEIAQLLLDNKANINTQDKCLYSHKKKVFTCFHCNLGNHTPLHLAVKFNRLDMVKLLLARKASPSLCRNNDAEKVETPLFFACLNIYQETAQDTKILDLLLQHISDESLEKSNIITYARSLSKKSLQKTQK